MAAGHLDTQVAVLHEVSDKEEIIIPVISGAAVRCWKAENRFELDFERLIERERGTLHEGR